ncbi:uncharacterized protein B0T15DRAFT_134748 [Chaetomium strumarium]|uniref:Uncharacterized protein n=1 Tax=Chaetomium strumarium TaxID=1170767 RepID=A0AAJ0H006_9PEZI|nr:hypothetical protein B0T15DRAFT_134748 [Chaetomium strumarium]
MEGERAQQALPPDNRPRRVRSRSHGDIRDVRNNNTPNRIYAGHGNSSTSSASPRSPAPYASHLRESSRTSCNNGTGRLPQPASRTPSPSPTRQRYQPPQALPAASIPDHSRRSLESLIRPTVLADRWSYDRERMPSPPPLGTHISQPGTPSTDGDVSEFGFSIPASTFTGSQPSSRPQSLLLVDTTPSTDPCGSSLHHRVRPSSPTLMVTPPPESSSSAPEQYSDLKGDQTPQRLGRRSFHSLTSAEMEILSHPPPAHPPMSAAAAASQRSLSSRSPDTVVAAAVASPNSKQNGHSKRELTSPTWERQGRARADNHGGDGEEEEEEEMTGKGCCLGLCEIGTAQRIGGTCGAWLMGTLLPIAFGTVLKCAGHLFAGCPS